MKRFLWMIISAMLLPALLAGCLPAAKTATHSSASAADAAPQTADGVTAMAAAPDRTEAADVNETQPHPVNADPGVQEIKTAAQPQQPAAPVSTEATETPAGTETTETPAGTAATEAPAGTEATEILADTETEAEPTVEVTEEPQTAEPEEDPQPTTEEEEHLQPTEPLTRGASYTGGTYLQWDDALNVIRIDGTQLSLPCPVAELLAAGIVMEESFAGKVLEPGTTDFGFFDAGSTRFTLFVRNRTDGPQAFADAVAFGINVDTDWLADVDITVSVFDRASTMDGLVSRLGEPFYVYEGEDLSSYYWNDKDYRYDLGINYDAASGSVYSYYMYNYR